MDYVPDLLRRKFDQYTSLSQQPEEGWGDSLTQGILGLAPGVGQAMAGRDIARAWNEGDVSGLAEGVAGLIPGTRLVKALRKPANELIAGARGAMNVPGKRATMDAAEQRLKRASGPEDSPDSVWKEMGMYQDTPTNSKPYSGMNYKSQHMKWEIDDSKAVVKADFGKKKTWSGNLEDAIDHPEFFQAYPEMRKYKVKLHNSDVKPEGVFKSKLNKATGDYEQEIGVRNPKDSIRSTLLHEMQHAIQHSEGFDPGSDYKPIADKLRAQMKGAGEKAIEEEAMKLYKRNKGETEARTVEARKDWTPEQRAAARPNTRAGAMDLDPAEQTNFYPYLGA